MPKAEITTRPWEEGLTETLRDPEVAAHYLEAASEERNPAKFQRALGQVIKAQGGISKAARTLKVNRANLSLALSGEGNPSFASIFKLIEASGLRMKFEARKNKSAA